jgi:hypothetical protein
VRRATTAVVVASLLGVVLPVFAQGGQSSQHDDGLILELFRTRSGTASDQQQTLTIRFANAGKVAVTIPEPMKFCADTMNGFVMVYKKVLSRSRSPETGHGCAAHRGPRKDILADAESWRRLGPGETYDIIVPLQSAVTLNPDARYELLAKYYPPHLSSTELGTLAANGIIVVQQTIESPPIIIEPQQ